MPQTTPEPIRAPAPSAQLELSGADWPAPVFLENETPHEWTGEQLRAHRPDVAEAMIKLYLAGVSHRQLRRAFNVSPLTVRAILRSSKVVSDSAREGLALDFRHTAGRLRERIDEVLDDDDQRGKVGAKDAAFAAAQLAERADAMQGRSTMIIDVLLEDPGRDEFASLVMGLGGRKAATMRAEAIDAEVIEPTGPAQIEGEIDV